MFNFLTVQVLVKISYIDFWELKTLMGGRRLCSKFEINMWQKHFQSTMDHKTWDGFETTSINWIWKQWVIEYWNWTMVTCRGRKELFWYLEKTKVFALQKTLKKSKSPYGVTGALCQIIFVLRKNKYFFGSPKILEKTKMSLWA